VADSYYSRRSAQDPAWRDRQIAAARERKRRARAADPDAARRANTDYLRRHRAKVRAHGVTFRELLKRSPRDDRETLALVLAQEVASGRVDLKLGRLYVLNGTLPEDVKCALLDL
jgi:hypothetical protein